MRFKGIEVASVTESWHAPGYRDPEVIFHTAAGDYHFKLSPQAFVQMHDMLCAQQACIDKINQKPLDIEAYPYQTRNTAIQRKPI